MSSSPSRGTVASCDAPASGKSWRRPGDQWLPTERTPAVTDRERSRLRSPRISPERIEEAARFLDPAFADSPQLPARELSSALGLQLVVKDETANPIRSFKGRGTSELVRTLQHTQERLVCASAGNFGQGLAYAGARAGHEVHVFAAASASPLKLEAIRCLGARVHVGGRDFDAAKEQAREAATELGGRFVEDGREVAVSEGAGTIAVELLRRGEPPDAVVVPLGNGALIAGIGHYLRSRAPTTKVIGVCAAGAPAMERSWRSGVLVATETAETIADGIAVRIPVPEALDDLRGVVDDVVLVADELVMRALRAIHETLGIAVEPSGAVGVAGTFALAEQLRGLRVATVLTGGNVAPDELKTLLSDG